MSSVSIQTPAATSHSHPLAPGPVITSGMLSPSPSPSPSFSSIVSGSIPPIVSSTAGGLPSVSVVSSAAGGTPTTAPSIPSSAAPAVLTFTQKKLSLALAIMIFLPAVINAL